MLLEISKFLFILLNFIFLVDAVREYEGYKVVKVNYENSRVRRFIQELDKNVGFMPDYLGSSNNTASYFTNQQQTRRLARSLGTNNISYSIQEINPSIFKIRKRRDLNRVVTINDIESRFLSYDEHIQFLNTMVQKYPNLLKLQSLGNSYEGRAIVAAKIGETDSSKPIIWIEAGTHAREWITYNVALYSIYQLISDPTYRPLLERVQIVIVPNTNPDGYEYSRSSDRMWRKTRSRFFSSRCSGADTNRNYPFHWAEPGASLNPCREDYCGIRSASEPEVLALTTAIQQEEARIKAYVSLHSYGQQILYPFGHRTNTYPPDVQDLIDVGKQIANAIRGVNNTDYGVFNSGDSLYPASGASDDWAKSRGIKYSYTMELAPADDGGSFGFLLAESQIRPTCVEVFQGLLVLFQQVSTEFASASQSTQSTQSTQQAQILKYRAFTRNRSSGRG